MANSNFFLNAERKRRPMYDKEVINGRLVMAMFGLAGLTLVIVTAAVVGDRPLTGQPHAAAPAFERVLMLEGNGNLVTITDMADGRVIMDGENGGFIAVVIDGLERARVVAGVTDNPPVTITQFENGRLQLSDPATGWSTEIASFGPGNLGTWQAMLAR